MSKRKRKVCQNCGHCIIVKTEARIIGATDSAAH